MQTQIYYGFSSKKTGELLHITKEVNTNGYACNETRVTFTTDENEPEYLVDERVTAEKARLFNNDWYNSTTDRPSHGNIDLNAYQVVKVTKTTKVEELEPLPKIRLFGRELKTCVSHSTDKKLTVVILNAGTKVKEGDLFWRDPYSENPEEVINVRTVKNFLEVTLRPYLINLEK